MLDLQQPEGFESRLTRSVALFRQAIEKTPKAAVLCSFGKESLCLLALAAEGGLKLDIAYFELGADKRRHRFARQFIAQRISQITVLFPHRTSCAFGAGGVALSYHFRLRCGDEFQILGATFDQDSSGLSCGLEANLVRQAQHDPYDWDLLIAGRRRSDIDDTLGVLAVQGPSHDMPNGGKVLLPLLEWSDRDVAFYLSRRTEFAADQDRYDLVEGKLIGQSKGEANPDYAPVCIRCLSVSDGERPECPLGKNPPMSGLRIPAREHFVSGKISPSVML